MRQGDGCPGQCSPGLGRGYAAARACVQSCLTFCDPTDCSSPGSSVHGSFQARILEWVATSYSRGSSPPRDRTRVSCIGKWILQLYTSWEARKKAVSGKSPLPVNQGLYLTFTFPYCIMSTAKGHPEGILVFYSVGSQFVIHAYKSHDKD